MRVATHCGEATSINDGCVERRFFGAGDWELRGIVPEVFGFAERAFPQPDRSVSGNRRHAMQTHRRQSSLSGNGALLLFSFSSLYNLII